LTKERKGKERKIVKFIYYHVGKEHIIGSVRKFRLLLTFQYIYFCCHPFSGPSVLMENKLTICVIFTE